MCRTLDPFIVRVLRRRSSHGWLVLASLLWSTPVLAEQLDWLKLVGAPGYDEIFDIAADSTGVYVVGRVRVALPGQSDGFELDAYVRKLNFDGSVLWTRQFELADADGPSTEGAFGLALAEGGIFVVGSFDCLSACSVGDGNTFGAFIARFRGDGALAWKRSIPDMHEAWRIVAHGGSLYVAGGRIGTTDPSPVITRVDLNGDPVWSHEPGGPGSFVDITVDDSGIYGVGSLASTAVQPLDHEGNPLPPIGSDGFSGRRIAADPSGIYVIGRGPLNVIDFQVRKYSRDGALRWLKKLTLEPSTLDVDAEGILLGQQFAAGYEGYVSRFTRGGNFVWRGQLGQSRIALYASAAHDGRLLLAGAHFGPTEPDTDSFLARFSFTHPPQLRSLGEINGTPAIAVMIHDSNRSRVVIKIRDARSRALLGRIDDLAVNQPLDLVVLPDVSGNGAPELAIVGVQMPSGDVVADVRDSLTGASLGSVPFNKRYASTQFAAVPGLAGSETGLVALGDSTVDRSMRAQIRSVVTGAALSGVGFDRYYYSQPFSQLVVLPDVDGRGSDELAVALFARRDEIYTGAPVQVFVKDSLTGTMATEFALAGGQALLDMAALPDLNGNGSNDLGFLELGVNRRGIHVAVHDGRSGELVRNVYYRKSERSVQLVSVPDLNGNGSAEAGVLALDVSPGTDRLEIKDLATGATIRSVSFAHPGWIQRGVDAVPDLNDNGSHEVAQLQEHATDGRTRVLIKDARTGERVHYIGI